VPRLPQLAGKTLTDHRLDGRDWFRAVTAGLLDEPESTTDGHDRNRYIYTVANRHSRDVDSLTDRIFRSIAARSRARMALRLAETQTAPPTPPAEPREEP
jgi:hypothetical protein